METQGYHGPCWLTKNSFGIGRKALEKSRAFCFGKKFYKSLLDFPEKQP